MKIRALLATRAGMATAAAACALVLAGAGPASASGPQAGPYHHGGWYLTAPTFPGPVTLTWRPDPAVTAYWWWRLPAGHRPGHLRAVASSDPVSQEPLCAAVARRAVVMEDCAPVAAQRWTYTALRHIRRGGWCMTVARGRLVLRRCGGRDASGQAWKFTTPPVS